uniref:Wsv285 n=1 Tax=White spot syndrome virus TaxID=92652 RepID=Q91B56_WSSV|nr:unknown [White spot syndrome virus]
MKRGDDIIDVVKSKGLSLREFSKKVSKIVRRFNEITNQLCNNCNVNSSNGDVDFHVFTSVCVYIHNIIPVLEDISIFAELGEELTKLVKECRDVAGEDKTYDDMGRNYEITVKYFKLFNALVKFCHRNYNVAVTSAINRRGYMCMVSNLVGYYCKLSDNAIQYHESLCSLHSSISYADYYTSRNNNSEDGGGNSSSEKSNADVAKTMASFYDQFDKSEDSKKNKNKTSNEILIKMFQMDRVLDGMDDDDDEDSDSSSSENEEEEEEEEIVKKPAKKRKVEDVDSNKKTLPKEPAVKKVKQEEDVEMEEVKEAAAEEEKKEEQEAKEEDATEYDDDTEEDEKAVASDEDEDDEDSKAIF